MIDTLVGIAPGSPLDAIRARRPEARTHAQASYRALFAPEIPGDVTAQERFAVGSFVTGLHGEAAIAAFYAAGLAASGASAALREAVDAAIAEARAQGPYGSYPAGPLSREDTAGPVYRVGAETRRALGPRLAAAFEHMHLLVFHPRDADAGGAAGAAGRRLVHDRHRDALPDRRLPVLPDPGGRRIAHPGRPLLTREVPTCPIRSSFPPTTRFPSPSPGRSSIGCPGSSR